MHAVAGRKHKLWPESGQGMPARGTQPERDVVPQCQKVEPTTQKHSEVGPNEQWCNRCECPSELVRVG